MPCRGVTTKEKPHGSKKEGKTQDDKKENDWQKAQAESGIYEAGAA
jgi:hypothetical protein